MLKRQRKEKYVVKAKAKIGVSIIAPPSTSIWALMFVGLGEKLGVPASVFGLREAYYTVDIVYDGVPRRGLITFAYTDTNTISNMIARTRFNIYDDGIGRVFVRSLAEVKEKLKTRDRWAILIAHARRDSVVQLVKWFYDKMSKRLWKGFSGVVVPGPRIIAELVEQIRGEDVYRYDDEMKGIIWVAAIDPVYASTILVMEPVRLVEEVVLSAEEAAAGGKEE